MAFESNYQAGDELLQFPPVSGNTGPALARRKKICCDPFEFEVNTIHFPFGET